MFARTCFYCFRASAAPGMEKNQGGKKNETFQIMDGSVIAVQQFIGAVIGRIGLHDGICGNCKPGAWHPDQ